MSYAQHMKHWKNHRKDCSFQQCAPLITANPGRKKDFPVITTDGEYSITAYCYAHAMEIAIENGLTLINESPCTC